MKLQKLIGIVTAGFILFSLAACSPKVVETPTQEPTATESPTETMEPTETETPAVTETLDGTQQPALEGTQPAAGDTSGAGAAAAPTKPAASAGTTGGQPASTAPDKYQYISQTLADGYQVRPNTSVTITWTVKNIGTTAWGKDYSLRFFAGPEVKNTYINFPRVVAANAPVDLTVTFTTPAQSGDYDLWYKLTNAQNQNFGDVDFRFTVTGSPNNSAKPAGTAKPAATAKPTP